MIRFTRHDAHRLLADLAREGLGSPGRVSFAPSAKRIASSLPDGAELRLALLDLAYLLQHADAHGAAQGVGAVLRALRPGRPMTPLSSALRVEAPWMQPGASLAALRLCRRLPPPCVALRVLHADAARRERLLSVCRGKYQRALVLGQESLSGSSLRGKARSYAGRYAASRAAVLARLNAIGVAVTERRGQHGRRILVLDGVDA